MNDIQIENAVMTFFFPNMIECELTIERLDASDSNFSFIGAKQSTVII